MAPAELIQADDPQAVPQAMAVLERGGLVAIPTDTVYGLAANVWSAEAVDRIYSVKGRSELKAIPVLLAGASDLLRVAPPPTDAAWAVMRRFWPGPLTVVVKRRAEIPQAVSPSDTIGLRVPDQAFALDLLASAGPLAVTSANRSGQQSATTAEQVWSELGQWIELIVDGGETPGGVPSTVVDCSSDPPRLLREGPIPFEAIQRELNALRLAEAGSG